MHYFVPKCEWPVQRRVDDRCFARLRISISFTATCTSRQHRAVKCNLRPFVNDGTGCRGVGGASRHRFCTTGFLLLEPRNTFQRQALLALAQSFDLFDMFTNALQDCCGLLSYFEPRLVEIPFKCNFCTGSDNFICKILKRAVTRHSLILICRQG